MSQEVLKLPTPSPLLRNSPKAQLCIYFLTELWDAGAYGPSETSGLLPSLTSGETMSQRSDLSQVTELVSDGLIWGVREDRWICSSWRTARRRCLNGQATSLFLPRPPGKQKKGRWPGEPAVWSCAGRWALPAIGCVSSYWDQLRVPSLVPSPTCLAFKTLNHCPTVLFVLSHPSAPQ